MVEYSIPGMRLGFLPTIPLLYNTGGHGTSLWTSKGSCIHDALGTLDPRRFSIIPATFPLPQGLPGTLWRMGPTTGTSSRCLGFALTSWWTAR